MRGRVLALQAIVFLGSTPIGGPIVGWVCDAFGPRAGFVVGGVGALGAAAWGYLPTVVTTRCVAGAVAADVESSTRGAPAVATGHRRDVRHAADLVPLLRVGP